MLSISNLVAQDSIKINLSNQYKQPVENEKVNINSIDYNTDDSGNVTINKPVGDSLIIMHAGYDNKIIALKDINSQNQVVLEKQFTWTDLLTPMFYILYGGLWLLLFIIFAETGLFVGFFFPGDSLLFVWATR